MDFDDIIMKTVELLLSNEEARSYYQSRFRYVLVDGYSNFTDDIKALGEHFKDYKQIERVEILPYHTLGVHKYEAMNMEYKLKNVEYNTPEQLEDAKNIFQKYFKTVYVN